MKLVEHHRADAVERHVIEQPSQQDAGRRHDQPRVAAHARIEANLVADLLAEPTVAQLGDSPRDGPGREPARLHEHQLLSRRQIIEHRRRHEHRLARAGRRGDDDRPAARRGHRFGEHAGDRQIGR